MTHQDARVIACGLIPDGFDAERLTARGRQEVRDAIDRGLALIYDPFGVRIACGCPTTKAPTPCEAG